jgi:hypothetical protein
MPFLPERKIMFVVGVQLYDNRTGNWSKPYSYISSTFVRADEDVIVPTGKYFSVGRTVGSKEWNAEKHHELAWYKSVAAVVTGVLK